MMGNMVVEAETRILPADDPEAIAEAVSLLRDGQVVAFPTDTVYGVGAHAFIERAVAALYRIKERTPDKSIPLLLSDASDLPQVSDPVPALAWELARHFWPGALTLVVPKGPHILSIVSAGHAVAVRVPRHPVVPEIIGRLGVPLATTSANLSGGPNPVTAHEVLAQLGGRLRLILDGGPCPGGLPSTVLDLTLEPPQVLRQGGIPPEALEACLRP